MRLLPILLLLSCTKEEATDTESAPPVDSEAVIVDGDGDTWTVEDGDCDDADADVYPGAEELCDGADQNCNDLIDEGWPDADFDAVADCMDVEECDGQDNDGDASVDEDFADGDGDGVVDCLDSEDCDGVDNDGDGDVDEGYDFDEDGWLPCGAEGAVLDCDDRDAAVNPDEIEADGDLVDNDCDGLIDEGDWAEGDLVVVEMLVNPEAVSDPVGEWIELLNVSGRTLYMNGLVLTDGDLDYHMIESDEVITLAPDGLFLAALSDNSGVIADYIYAGVSLSNEDDLLAVWAGDVLLDEVIWDDGETFPDASGASVSLDPEFFRADDNDRGGLWCEGQGNWTPTSDQGTPGELNPLCDTLDRDNDGFTPEDGDCDDADPTIGPHVEEVPYDGIDNDCDPDTYDDDLDRDGYLLADDCDDDDALINPAGLEICDGADNDCDTLTDDDDDSLDTSTTTDWYPDDDGDGFGAAGALAQALCAAPADHIANDLDCDDDNADVNPDVEEVPYDGLDNDCDPASLEDDLDGDGYPLADDCDDDDPVANPGGAEVCDDLNQDEDCDGRVDDSDLSATGQYTWYPDEDGDGYGDPDGETLSACDAPADHVRDRTDCDDTDAAYNPGVIEACDETEDLNCDGSIGDLDLDFDGFACSDDCDDSDGAVHPYAYEDTTDGIDNDCDGDADGADTDLETTLRLSDDDYETIRFSSVTFPFCGSDYTSVNVSSNGRITIGFTDTSYTESSSTFTSQRNIAGHWDDLNPSSGGTVSWIEYPDAVGVYFRSVPEYSSTGANTFSMVMIDDGRVMLDYGDVSATDGLAGWSCGGTSAGETDLTAAAASVPAGSAGIGQGTESAVHELFSGDHDLDSAAFMFCVGLGTDSDGDGWTDECGDRDDGDDSVHP